MSKSATPETLYLVDGHAQFFRAYFAIRGGLNSPITSEPTNMVYGFTSLLAKLLRECKPAYLALVIDAAGDRGTFRSKIYPEYKAHREEPPDDFGPQVQRCIEVAQRFNIPLVAVPEVEADDAIATIVRRLRREKPSLRIRIVSKDKDLGQLLDSSVTLFDGNTGAEVTVEDLFDSKGVRPEQVVDMLTLMGDTVDNVPGVKGIGPKTAAALITEFGSLDKLLANLDKVKGKKGEAIAAAREQLPISKQLVTLKDDCDFQFDLESSRVDLGAVPPGALLELLRTLGFGRLREEVRALLPGAAGAEEAAPAGPTKALQAGAAPAARGGAAARAPAAATKPGRRKEPQVDAGEGTLFGASGGAGLAAASGGAGAAAAGGITPHAVDGDYRGITDAKSLEALIREVRGAVKGGALLAVDTETDGLSPVSSNLCGVSLSVKERSGVYVPLRSPEPEKHLTPDAAIKILRPLLEDPAIPKVGHNLKFDLNILRSHGIDLTGIVGDSMVASYVVDATRTSHKLDALSEALLNHRCIPLTDLIGSGKQQKTFDQVDLGLAVDYAAEDADIALRLHRVLGAKVGEMGLEKLYREVEVPLVEVLAELEFNGIRLDPEELERQRRALEARIEELKRRINDAAPRPFNPDSPKQLSEILFNKPDADPPGLGLKIGKRTKTGASTDVEVLEKLAADPDVESEMPAMIVQYRQLTKLVGTYLVALRDAIDAKTGRVHAKFHQAVTATGRLSSSDPNLQNIPIRSEVGREIRRAFVAQMGNVLLSADYSQIELRILAHLSGDESLRDAFRRDQDIHTSVAAEVYQVAPAEVTGEQRSAAKMVNFGIVYGITAWGLARRLGAGTPVERAKSIIEGYKARFAGIDSFLKSCVEHARTHGYVATMLGRRRNVPQVHSKNPAERAFGERIAINTVVQGSAADLIKIAMINLHRLLPKKHPGARMLLQIHDELVFEVPEMHAHAVQATVVAAMEGAMSLSVPLKVESGYGANWFEA